MILAAVVGGIFSIASNEITSNTKREQFRFEKIYPKPVELIEKLHALTVNIETEMLSLTSPLQMQGTDGQKKLVEYIRAGERPPKGSAREPNLYR